MAVTNVNVQVICKHCGRPIYPIPEQRGYQHEVGIGVFCPATAAEPGGERKPVLDAAAAIPIQSWIAALHALRGVGLFMGDVINDDPTEDWALTKACEAEIMRLTDRPTT